MPTQGGSPGMARRGVLAAGMAGASGVAIAAVHAWTAGGGHGRYRPSPAPATGVQLPVGTGRSSLGIVQFVAHADDALYFMNPDSEQDIRAGHGILTVCLTSGEADGRNFARHDPRARTAPHDRPGFARARINGLRRAHAAMATGDESSPWDVMAVSPIPGWGAELHTLRAAPGVQLLFLALVEARGVSAWRPQSLKGLWQGAVRTLPQLLPAHSPVQLTARITREQLVACLQAILREYDPQIVRTLDPNPEHDPVHSGHRGFAPGHGLAYYDHQDHTHATYFVQQALAAHAATQDTPRMSVEHYLGYVNGRLPWNLDSPAVHHKAGFLDIYGWSDHRGCGDPSGCGDLKVGGGALRGAWVQSTRYRAPGAAAWSARAHDGRLTAFALLSGQAVGWYETRPGSGTWTGPAVVPGRGLEGQIGVVVRRTGALQLFSVRTVLPDARGRGVHRREVVTAVQRGTAADGRPLFSAWTSLGTAESSATASMEMGYPEAAVGHDGTVYVAVRTQAGGVAVRAQTAAGRWLPWTRLPKAAESGIRLSDGLGVAVDAAGRVHVFAPGRRSVQHWVSPGGGRPFALARPTGLPGAAGPVTAIPGPDGSLLVAYREPRTARVVLASFAAGAAAGRVLGIGEPDGGFGRVALLATDKGRGLALAARNELGTVSLGSAGPVPGHWSRGSALVVHTPALAADRSGRMVALALGGDGQLWRAVPEAGGGTGQTRWEAAVTPTARGANALTRAFGSPTATGQTGGTA